MTPREIERLLRWAGWSRTEALLESSRLSKAGQLEVMRHVIR